MAYRRITALLNDDEGSVNHKRVERIWRQEGLKVPPEAGKAREALAQRWLLYSSRPEHKDHVWSYDFVDERTTDGRKFRILNIIDEYTRECLESKVGRGLGAQAVLDSLFELFILRGIPEHIRSDNGDSCRRMVRKWLAKLGVKTLFIEPGSPWGEWLH